jgi:hypothetical protein
VGGGIPLASSSVATSGVGGVPPRSPKQTALGVPE